MQSDKLVSEKMVWENITENVFMLKNEQKYMSTSSCLDKNVLMLSFINEQNMFMYISRICIRKLKKLNKQRVTLMVYKMW